MRHFLACATAAVAVSAAAVATATTADAAAPSAPSASTLTAPDARFLVTNTQTDLAEITLARIVLARTDDPAARELAEKTMADHMTALHEARALARADGVTLPTTPNPMQQQAAAQLKAAQDVPLTYFQLQVAGHLRSISQTHHELERGSQDAVVSFASSYLPVAVMHLRMARQDLRHETR